jgi:DNA-binding GntR family transcriptional regulator
MLEVAAVRHLATAYEARQAVHGALAELEALRGSDDWEAVRDADLNFHHAIVDSLGSARTTKTFDSLMSELRLVFLQLKHEFRDPTAIAADHAGIVAAIESNDADAAETAIRGHLDSANEQLQVPSLVE